MSVVWENLNVFIFGTTLPLMALGLVVSIIMPGMDRWSKRFFCVFFSTLMADVVTILVEEFLYGQPSMLLVARVAYILDSIFVSVPIPILTVYLLHCCAEGFLVSPIFRLSMCLWAVFLVLLGIAQFQPALYSIAPNNQFVRGSWFPLMLLPLIVIMLINTVGTIRRRNTLSKRYFLAFLIYLLPLTAAIIIHEFVTVYPLIGASVTLTALVMYVIILTDQLERYLLQQQKIAQQHASIAVLQMRPHFIYNTMTSIYYLCDQDPKKAQQVTMDFTTYLRKNLTAIASEDVVPFAEELEHTRAYLAVEQAQFEDMLIVDYDVPHVQFRVPPLTLQPIVENAIKHGLDPDSEPLHVEIRTRATSRGGMIMVADNGPGFDPAIADDPNTTLANIRQRLEMMCNGSLTIVCPPSGGTVVRITIP